MDITTAVENFILDRRARALRPATIVTYRRQLQDFLIFAGDAGATDLADIDVYFLRRFMRGCSAGIACRFDRGQCLRVFLNWAVAEGLMDASPMARVKMPKLDAPKPDSFTTAEIRTLLDAALSARETALVYFLLDTGARLGETAALTVGDIDLAAGRVTLRTQTKSRRPRSVFLGERARSAMAAYLAEVPSAGPLWLQADGVTPLSAKSLQEAVKRLGRRAGVHPCGRTSFDAPTRDGVCAPGWSATICGALWGIATIACEVLRQLDDDDLQHAHQVHGPVDHWLG